MARKDVYLRNATERRRESGKPTRSQQARSHSLCVRVVEIV